MSTTATATDAVLFDLDGTLIDTRSIYLEAYRRAVEPYLREDLTPEDIMALRPTSEIAFLRAVVPESDFDACLDGFYRAYQALHVGGEPGVFPGVPATLARLRRAGAPLGLVTGKSRRSWEITRAVTDSLEPFDVLVFDDDVRAPKPDPHGLELALELLRVEPGRAVYVGDTVSDMEAARTAGVRPIAALWAHPPEHRDQHLERVRAVGATAAERPEALLQILALD
ncbi:MAG: HAD family hydrolase [Gemmatimonadota bacterium]